MNKPPVKAPVLYFDARAGSYWVENGPEFIPIDTGQARLHLRAGGCDPDAWDHGLNQVERALLNAQKERIVHYAGALAGWKPGTFETQAGRRVLVTSGPRIPTPKSGKCDGLEKFIGELLGGEQGQHFCLWLAAAYTALTTQIFRPGQFIGLAGHSGCGKSLLQSIVALALGGRSCCPYQYMIGDTKFNQHMAEAEVWNIEDKASSTDIRTRRKFGSAIKQATVNLELDIYPKNGKAITLPTFRRILGSFNRETENVMFMPPLDDSMTDKVNLYDCSHADVGDDRAKTWAMVTRELPAFLWQCLKLKVPAKWRDDRYGVKSYHNATLLEILTSAAPETRLMSIIDEAVFADDKTGAPWSGTATQMERELSKSDFSNVTAKLLYYSTACAVYLSRLAVKHPDRITSQKASNKPVVWNIVAP